MMNDEITDAKLDEMINSLDEGPITDDELNEIAVPDYSFGNDLDDEKLIIIRVNEGPFNKSVFSIAMVDTRTQCIEYRIKLFVYEDATITIPTEEMVEMFQENTVLPIAIELIDDIIRLNTKET